MSAIEKRPSGRSIEELTATASASRVSAFHQCRLRFFFQYIKGIEKTKSAALHVGSCTHLVLKHWNQARWKGESPTLKQFHDVYSDAWKSEQKETPVNWEEDSEDEEKKVGWKLFEMYYRESAIPPNEKPEAVEVKVEADLSHHGLPNLVGIIDLVRPTGRIVDFKTSSTTPNPRIVELLNEIQLASYGLMYRQCTGKKETAVELHHLVKTKNPKFVKTEMPPITQKQEDRLYRALDSYTVGVQREDWVPSPSMLCASCQFFNECKAHS